MIVKEKKSLDIGRSQSTWPKDNTEKLNKAEVTPMGEKLNNIHWVQISTTIVLAIFALWSAYFVTRALSLAKDPATKTEKSTQKVGNKTSDTSSQVTDQTTQANEEAPDQTANPFSPTQGNTSQKANTDTVTPPAKDSFKTRILNGNGTPGDASQLKTELVQKGFNVGTIGNARLKYDKTQIYYIAGQKDQADLVNQNLTGKQTEIQEAQSDLIGSGYQILVVIGKT